MQPFVQQPTVSIISSLLKAERTSARLDICLHIRVQKHQLKYIGYSNTKCCILHILRLLKDDDANCPEIHPETFNSILLIFLPTFFIFIAEFPLRATPNSVAFSPQANYTD
jgi:hypothetical protein